MSTLVPATAVQAPQLPGTLLLCGPNAPQRVTLLPALANAERLTPQTAPSGTLSSPLWCEGGTAAEWRRLLRSGTPTRRALDTLLRTGGTVGGDAPFSTAALAEGFLPELSCTLAPGSGLLIEDRILTGLGTAAVTFTLPASRSQPATEFSLAPRQRADALALRRARRVRLAPPRPKPQPPQVRSGALVIVGGGGMPEALTRRFVALAGGSDAVIAVIPISQPDPLPAHDPMAQAFREVGAKEVVELTGRTPDAVDRPESLAVLRRATGIWFGGGRQWRFVDAYEGTKALALMRATLARGGVIGGSSAGASIQGDYLVRGDPLGPQKIMTEGYEQGFAFLPGVAIDQHFTQRNRFADLASLVERHPEFLGIGLDEGTGIVVQGRVAEVVGRTRACFYDQKTLPQFTSVAAGSRYDLVARKELAP